MGSNEPMVDLIGRAAVVEGKHRWRPRCCICLYSHVYEYIFKFLVEFYVLSAGPLDDRLQRQGWFLTLLCCCFCSPMSF